MVSKFTKNPENNIVGMVVTGPRNTPVSMFIPAPISSPSDWATREFSTQMSTNIETRSNSIGCEVR